MFFDALFKLVIILFLYYLINVFVENFTNKNRSNTLL